MYITGTGTQGRVPGVFIVIILISFFIIKCALHNLNTLTIQNTPYKIKTGQWYSY